MDFNSVLCQPLNESWKHFSPGCYRITTIFSHAQTVVPCTGCSLILCQPRGGKCRLTEGKDGRSANHILSFCSLDTTMKLDVCDCDADVCGCTCVSFRLCLPKEVHVSGRVSRSDRQWFLDLSFTPWVSNSICVFTLHDFKCWMNLKTDSFPLCSDWLCAVYQIDTKHLLMCSLDYFTTFVLYLCIEAQKNSQPQFL